MMRCGLIIGGIAVISVSLGCAPGGGRETLAPYPMSPVIESITWDFGNLVRLAPGSDLWPITWAADDHLYTSWGDGTGFGDAGNDFKGPIRRSMGFSRIEASPNDLIENPAPNLNVFNVYGGQDAENPNTLWDCSSCGKSAGMLSVDGILYAWINMQDSDTPDHRLAWSSDLGATWQLADWKFSSRTFAPASFLNFGKDYAGARDRYVYSYGGKWQTSSPVYLARVPKNQIKNREAYEFFKGPDANGNLMWTTDDTQREPVFADPNSTDPNGANHASVVYNAEIRRYILTIPHGGPGKLGIFDAPEPWGPWTTVAYYDNWGGFSTNGEALIYVFPTKWISSDGKTMWMVFSGFDPPGRILDSFNLIKATLVLRTQKDATPLGAPTGSKLQQTPSQSSSPSN